jgi:quinol-cytochrome oxidoreductase complex cytochrome b subunit
VHFTNTKIFQISPSRRYVICEFYYYQNISNLAFWRWLLFIFFYYQNISNFACLKIIVNFTITKTSQISPVWRLLWFYYYQNISNFAFLKIVILPLPKYYKLRNCNFCDTNLKYFKFRRPKDDWRMTNQICLFEDNYEIVI